MFCSLNISREKTFVDAKPLHKKEKVHQENLDDSMDRKGKKCVYYFHALLTDNDDHHSCS